VAADEFGALEAGDDAAHGWRADLFGGGKFAERFGSAEDEDGKRGELGRTDSAFAVANAEAAQQVDRGGVELIGEFGCCGGRWIAGGVICGGNRFRGVWIGWVFAAALARCFFGLDRGHGR
jgi:hypothetical protein